MCSCNHFLPFSTAILNYPVWPDGGAVAFGDAIESANIVGYTQPSLTKDTLQNTGVCFVNTSGGDINLQDIIAYAGNSVAGDGTFNIRWFDGGKYSYARWSVPLYNPEDPEEELDYNGWGDLDEYCPVTKTFPAGGWFLVTPGVANASLQVSGELVSSDSTVPTYSVSLVKDTLQVCGNPFPVSCDIQSVVAMAGDAVASDGTFNIRWFDGGKYSYARWSVPLYNPEDPEEELDYNGWGDLDEYCPITKTFAVGEGFLVTPGVSSAKLAFPNPLYVTE